MPDSRTGQGQESDSDPLLWLSVAVSVSIMFVVAILDSDQYAWATAISVALLGIAVALRFYQQTQVPFRILAALVAVFAGLGWVAAGVAIARDQGTVLLDCFVYAGVAGPGLAVVWRVVYLATHFGKTR
jgi:hypothetical protein